MWHRWYYFLSQVVLKDSRDGIIQWLLTPPTKVPVTEYKDSIGTFIADLVLQILSWMAEEERGRITKWQPEGIDIALQNGTVFGRPKFTVTEEYKEVYSIWVIGEIIAVKAMQETGVKMKN